MFFENREYGIRTVTSAEELTRQLHDMSWTLCTGFRLGDVLYLNDASSENGAGEWAVLEVAAELSDAIEAVQFESVTFGWMDEDETLASIRGYEDAGERDRLKPKGPGGDRTVFLHPEGSCCYCA